MNTVFRMLLLTVLSSLLLACPATTPPANTPAVNAGKPTPKPQTKPVKIALVLGGGAARGFAHVGVIKVLEANGIEPKIVVGTSAGSVVGSLYAAGYSGFDLQKLALSLDQDEVGDWTLPDRGFIKGQALQDFINKNVKNQPIEKLKREFGAVATNLKTGQGVLFQRGNVGMAVRASSSVPGVFQPVNIAGVDYVDGGVVSPVPVKYARQMGADFIIAVDISGSPNSGPITSSKDVLLQSATIMGKTIKEEELKQASVVITPKVGQFAADDFDSKHLAILEGEKAAQALMPQIKQKLAALQKQ
ncbi:patatin-like phospholipase family protein [Leeia aquatica]|uniref:Patatin-like phospholipase family protein n=1 Tax=Leeia aquatica TaxID=2725557 RepID=A0A847RWF1_9NEIS|nr:patatin-like phospholipase family protein [Leeia aquatica]NLR75490.1 patatin-like phospholipase family protein [Leeia aquatica]